MWQAGPGGVGLAPSHPVSPLDTNHIDTRLGRLAASIGSADALETRARDGRDVLSVETAPTITTSTMAAARPSLPWSGVHATEELTRAVTYLQEKIDEAIMARGMVHARSWKFPTACGAEVDVHSIIDRYTFAGGCTMHLWTCVVCAYTCFHQRRSSLIDP